MDSGVPPRDDSPEPPNSFAPADTPAPAATSPHLDLTVQTNIDSVANGLTIGYSYLIQEERVENSFKIFSHLINSSEFTGLCFTRTNPRKIREKFNLDNVQMMWLTDQESEKETVVSPSLEGIIYIIEEFMDIGAKTILLIDGMEYLIGNNGFNPVLRFIRRLIDKISETETILLITISPDTMDERELKLLEREMEPIAG
jgi:hypothetical protein